MGCLNKNICTIFLINVIFFPLCFMKEIILPGSTESETLTDSISDEIYEDSAVYIINSEGNRSIFIYPEQDCVVVTGNVMIKRPIVILHKADKESFEQLAELCGELHQKRINGSEFLIGIENYAMFIYPGTKWCGAGNSAQNLSDLGVHRETDTCCREHDSCQNYVTGFSCRKDIRLCNRSPITRSHCDCDERFRSCLLSTGESVSKKIGLLYFTFFGIKCFREDYPAIKCIERGGFLKMHCQRYKYDESRPKIYQFFDSPRYSKPTKSIHQENTNEVEAYQLL